MLKQLRVHTFSGGIAKQMMPIRTVHLCWRWWHHWTPISCRQTFRAHITKPAVPRRDLLCARRSSEEVTADITEIRRAGNGAHVAIRCWTLAYHRHSLQAAS